MSNESLDLGLEYLEISISHMASKAGAEHGEKKVKTGTRPARNPTGGSAAVSYKDKPALSKAKEQFTIVFLQISWVWKSMGQRERETEREVRRYGRKKRKKGKEGIKKEMKKKKKKKKTEKRSDTK